MKKSVALISFICILSASFAQDTLQKAKPSYVTHIGIAYILGIQIYNDYLMYNPGREGFIVVHKPFSYHLNVGGGVSFISLRNENFVPLYIDLVSYKKNKKNSQFMNVRFGYAHAWNVETASLDNYDFKGGIYLAAGAGKKIYLNDNLSLLIQWKFSHQFAKMIYTVFEDNTYTKNINYDMLSISSSILF